MSAMIRLFALLALLVPGVAWGQPISSRGFPPIVTHVQTSAVTANGSIGTLPANAVIRAIYVQETAGHAVTGGVNIGSTAAGTDIASAIAVGANALVVINPSSLSKQWFSATASQGMFISAASAWNSASVNVWVSWDQNTGGTYGLTSLGGTLVGNLTTTGQLVSRKEFMVGPTAFSTSVDAEFRDVNGDGYTEVRLTSDAVDPLNNFMALYHHNDSAFIEMWAASGSAQLSIAPKPRDGTSNAVIALFDNSSTSGIPTLNIYDASGLTGAAHINQALSGKGNSYSNANAGMLGVGIISSSAPLATLHVEGVRGATTNEIARFTKAAASTAIGLSLGYNDAGNSVAYLYNRYSGNAASALSIGFGSTFGSLIALTATKDLNVAMPGTLSVGATTTPTDKIGLTGNLGMLGAAPKIYGRNGDVAGQIDIDFPEASTTAQTVRIGRNTATSGAISLTIFKGDGTNTLNTSLTGSGTSFIGASSGCLAIGGTSCASRTLNVTGDANVSGVFRVGDVAGVTKSCVASAATLTIVGGIITATSGC